MYKLLKKPFFGRFMVKWQNPLQEKDLHEWTKVETTSNSGGKIIGLFAKANIEKVKATIVLGHPMGKDAKGYFIKNGYTDLLRQNGFNTLVFDINGFGESSHGNFSYYEDIIAIGKKARAITPDIPLGYHGISLGGQWATIAFADDNHPYHFAIIESAATTLEEFWIKYPFAYATLKVLYLLLPFYARKIKMVERIKEAKNLKSILLIYSEADNWTPVAMGERFKKNCPIPTELWVLKNAEHAKVMKSEHKDEYQKKIVDFFNACTPY